MVDNDESSAGTADPSTAAIMTPTFAIVHPFLPTCSNGRIASTHMTSDYLICRPTFLFQSNDTTSFKLWQWFVMSSNPAVRHFFQLFKAVLIHSATEILTIRLRIASYRHLLSARLQCAVAPTIHSLDTKI
ncbi:hypothetical protein TNCV_3902271 [Trichonephila clavipes]|nr:hypothetical protein TNCV_3902271 [Trichonephila clavipes]